MDCGAFRQDGIETIQTQLSQLIDDVGATCRIILDVLDFLESRRIDGGARESFDDVLGQGEVIDFALTIALDDELVVAEKHVHHQSFVTDAGEFAGEAFGDDVQVERQHLVGVDVFRVVELEVLADVQRSIVRAAQALQRIEQGVGQEDRLQVGSDAIECHDIVPFWWWKVFREPIVAFSCVKQKRSCPMRDLEGQRV